MGFTIHFELEQCCDIPSLESTFKSEKVGDFNELIKTHGTLQKWGTPCSRACFLYKMRDCLHSSGEGGVEEKGMELIISKRAAGRKNLGKRRKSSNPTERW